MARAHGRTHHRAGVRSQIYEECGEDAKVGAVGSRGAKALGLLWPLAREGAEMVYQFERPFVVDSGKYASAFGGSGATPYREGIGRTVNWYRRHNPSGGSSRVSTVAHHARPEKAATRR